MQNPGTIALFSNTLSVAVSDQGLGRPYLLLHGGAGPGSMMPLAGVLSKSARAIVPTHPGFQGQARPEWFKSVGDLATAYLELLETKDLHDVVVVGNSVGGWIACEIALRNSPRVAGIVLLNAVGVDAGAKGKITDVRKVPPTELPVLSFYDPSKAVLPTTPEAQAARVGNMKTLAVYGGEHFVYDATLRARLAQVKIPALVAWGEADKVVDAEYGREFAQSIPGARFEVIAKAGHLPQIEQTGAVAALVSGFAPNQKGDRQWQR